VDSKTLLKLLKTRFFLKYKVEMPILSRQDYISLARLTKYLKDNNLTEDFIVFCFKEWAFVLDFSFKFVKDKSKLEVFDFRWFSSEKVISRFLNAYLYCKNNETLNVEVKPKETNSQRVLELEEELKQEKKKCKLLEQGLNSMFKIKEDKLNAEINHWKTRYYEFQKEFYKATDAEDLVKRKYNIYKSHILFSTFDKMVRGIELDDNDLKILTPYLPKPQLVQEEVLEEVDHIKLTKEFQIKKFLEFFQAMLKSFSGNECRS